MLGLPTSCVRQSINEHNSDLSVFCDWLEASALLTGDDVSLIDVADILIENRIYSTQDFAKEQYAIALTELRRRRQAAPSRVPWKLEGTTIVPELSWEDVPAHSFCLVLSLAEAYPKWAASFGKNYTEQGELFELLTHHSLAAHGWSVLRTGWGRSTASKIQAVAESVADWLGEPVGHVDRWVDLDKNEVGLDLVCADSFLDEQGGRPVFLVQCASGRGWEQKQYTPELDVWSKLVDFSSDPRRAFAMPFALTEDDFRKAARRTNGMFLDRCRLLSAPPTEEHWIPPAVKKRMTRWMKPRIARLPRI